MRPVRLEMEGFAAYRDRTVVDFDGVELFALTGATGAGKSTVIDAICFALYGSVPRYDDKRVVAPAISQGMPELRVRLDFTVDDVAYSATRVVRRTKQGATTREARLESGDVVLAGTADELTAAATELLGLGFDHFTKCVVLPQGAFARFLHDKPGDRQDLLKHLLDLGTYEQMATAARTRQRDAHRDVESLQHRLADLAAAAPEPREALVARIGVLEALAADLGAEVGAVTELAARATEARRDAEAAATTAQQLEVLTVPAAVAELAGTRARAADQVEVATAQETTARLTVGQAEVALAAAGDRSALERQALLHAQRATVLVELDGLASAADALGREATTATAAAEATRAEAIQAEAAFAAAQAANRAHALRAHLVAGEPCPVCEQSVATVPADFVPADIRLAQDAHRLALAAAADGDTTASHAAKLAGEADARRVAAADRLGALDRELSAGPGVEAVAIALGAIAAAGQALDAARAEDQRARSAATGAREALERARAAEGEARKRFTSAHVSVAPMGAPDPAGDDLAADWAALATWAAATAPGHRAAAAQALEAATAADAQRTAALRRLAERCATADVALAPGADPMATVVSERAAIRERLARLDVDLATAERLRTEAAARSEAAAVAGELAKHLDAKHFEKWLLDDVLDDLVQRAGATLRELSGGQYSLAFNGDFAVVDHRNADQERPARTLSGGETFMASLALALALAERLSQGSGGRLDALFLDEGFGSLDPDALDVVASAIEELGSRGRMIGLISHVPELAERVPVRFEVRRTGNASTIEKVVA